MSEKHLKGTPHKIRGTETAWWYEEPKGLCLVVECPGSQGAVTRQITIPWHAILGAVKRLEAKP